MTTMRVAEQLKDDMLNGNLGPDTPFVRDGEQWYVRFDSIVVAPARTALLWRGREVMALDVSIGATETLTISGLDGRQSFSLTSV